MSQVDASSVSSSPAPVELGQVLDPAGRVDPQCFAAAEARLVAEMRWNELAALYDAAVARAPDPETGRRYLLLSGLLWAEKLNAPRQAEPRLRRVLASDPDHPDALAALKDLCVAGERIHEAADLLDRAIEVSPASQKPDLLLALADLAYPGLQDPNRALLALRYAYEVDPNRVDVVTAARRVLVAERRWADAKHVLDDQAAVVLGAGDEPDPTVELPTVGENAEAAVRRDTVDMDGAPPDGEAGRAIQAVSEIADGYLDLGLKLLPHATEHDLAEGCLGRARALGQEGALSRLDELAHLRQTWESAADNFRVAAFESRNKTDAAAMYLQAAELVHAYGQDPGRADELIERSLLLVPGYGPALDFLQASHASPARRPELIRRLNAMVAAVRDPGAKVEVLLRVARLAEEDAAPAEEDAAPTEQDVPSSEAIEEARNAALNAYRRVLAIRPDHRDAVQRCGALLMDAGLASERAQVLETYLAAIADPYAQVQTHLSLGRLYAQSIGDSGRSRAHFEAVLTRDPNNFEAATALRALYKDAGEHAAHLGVLRVLLNYAPDRGTRLEMLNQMVEVASSVGPEESFSVLRQIFELDPDGTHDRLVEAAEALQRFLPLAESYVSAARSYNGTRAVQMWIAAGQLFDERLPRPRDAIQAYREALKLDGRNDDARSALERLLAEQDDPEALLEVLRSRLEEAESDGDRALLLARIGEILDRDLGQMTEAVETYERVLAIEPQHAVALSSLDDLHRRLEHWPALEQILLRREALAESDEDRVALMVRRARLLDEPLGRAEEGADVLLELLARVPDHPAVLEGLADLVGRGIRPLPIARALEPIYGQRGQYAAQVEMLRRLSEHEATPEARSAVARRAAQVAESRLNDPASALDLVAAGLKQTPEHEELLDSLIRLARETQAPEKATEVLGPLVEVETQPETIAALAYRLGELREDALNDPDGAISAYRTALDADAHHGQALAALERLLGLAERYEELAALLQTRLAAAEDGAAKVQFGMALATLQDARLEEPEAATATLRTLLEESPKDAVVLGRLAEVLERRGQWRELLTVLDRRRDATEDPDVQTASEAKAGDILAQHLDEPKAAIARYRTALERRPDHGAAIRGLEALLAHPEHQAEAGALLAPAYEAVRDSAAMVRALEAQLATTTDADTRRSLFVRIAELQTDALDEPGAAFEALTRAFQEGLLQHDALDRLAELAAVANRSKALAQVYEHAVEKSPDDVELLRALARLYDGAAGAPGRAKETWQRIVEKEPTDVEALEALERLMAAGDRPEALAVVLVARGEAAETPDLAAAFFKRAAAVFEETAGNIPKALEVTERARDLRPTDRSLWQELARYYRALGRTEAARDALAAEADLVEAPLERARILVALAEAKIELDDVAGAVQAYRTALDAQPDHAGARAGLESLLDGPHARLAAEALEPVYRRAGDWARLVETYETMVDRASETSERVERLVAIRSIYEERLGRPDLAFNAASRAFAEAPDQPETLDALERLGRAGGAVESLITLLGDRVQSLPPEHPLRAELLGKMASYAEDVLGDQRQAISLWQQANDAQPEATEPLVQLDRLFELTGDAREQVDVQKALAEQASTAAGRANHLVKAATILEDRLGDRSAAAFQYEQVLVQVPGHDGALDRLAALYEDARAHFELGRVLEQAALHRLGGRRAQALMRLGAVRSGPLEDPRGAVSAFGEVLRMDPTDAADVWDAALTALDSLMGSLVKTHPDLAAEAGQRVERHWKAKGDALKVIEAKEAQIAGPIEWTVRKRLLLDVAQLYEDDLGKPEMAFMSLARAFSIAHDDALADSLDRVAPLAGTEEELADLYAQALPSVEDSALAVRLARTAASLNDTKLDRPEAAIAMYNRVLSLVPDDPAALTALERLYGRMDDAKGLLTVYRGQLRVAEGDDERTDAVWRKVAAVADQADSADATFEAYRALLDRRPDDLDILKKMATLCERTGRIEDLWSVLDREASIVDDEEARAQILLRMGTLAKNDLRDDARAVDAFARALQARPEDPGAVAGLAGLVREEGPARPQAAAALAPVYRDSAAFEAYITCLEIQGAAMPPGEDKKSLYVEIAEVYETRLRRPERAFTWACRALHEDRDDHELRMRVERLAEAAGLMDDLAAFYLDELEDAATPEAAVGLRRRVAEIYDHSTQNPASAIEQYNLLLDMAPGDSEALVALARLLPQVGEYGSLGDVYRRRIAQASAPEMRIQLLRQFARLQSEQLRDMSGAVATLRRLLELQPDDLDALQLLSTLLDGDKRVSERTDVLANIVEVAGAETTEGREARVQLAQARAAAGDLSEAESLLRAVIDEAPDHPGAREVLQERFEDAVAEEDIDGADRIGEVLADALRRTEAWPDLITVLRVRGGLRGGKPQDRIALNIEAGRLYRDQLGRPELAFTTLANVIREAPGLADVRGELDALADELGLQEPLVDALEAARESAPDPEVRAQIDRRIAQLVTDHLHEPERAARWWQIVLADAPNDPEALAALDPLFMDLGKWAALTDVLERRVELTEGDPDQQFDILMRLAHIWDEWLGEKEEAVGWYERARALRPHDASVLAALSRLLDPETHPQALFEVLEAHAEEVADLPSKVRLWARMAKVVDEHLDRPEDAIHWWSQVRRVDPSHREAADALERLFERTQKWSELADLLEAQLTEAPDERTMLRLQRRLGLVRGTRLGSVDEAVRAWTEILRRNPNDVEALEALCQIYRESEQWDDLVATLRQLIPLQSTSEGVKAVRFELAEVFLNKLEATEDAIESAKRVLDVEPHTVVELKRLEEIFVATGAHGEAVKVMNARAAMADSRGQRIEILFDIARVYEEQIGRRAGAAAAYEQVLELEPTSQKAYEALAAAYEGHGDYRKLGELYTRRLEVTERPEERRSLLLSIIEIQERWLGQPELAFTVACRAFGEDPSNDDIQQVAERLADETDNWDVLAEVYEEQVDLVPAGRAVELRRRLAEIRLDRLEEPEEAERQFRLVLSMRADDDAARDRLIELYGGQERWSSLVEQLAERADLTGDVEEKRKLLHQIAHLHEARRNDNTSAVTVLKRILEFDPDDDVASQGLSRLYRAEEKWHPLLVVLERRMERAETREAELDIRTEMAGVWAQGLRDIPQAIETYRDILAIDERHAPALNALERLLTVEERWGELIEIYERQVALAIAEGEAIGLLTKIATIHEERFRDLNGASRTLIRILEIDPEHRPTLMALARVWRDAGEWSSLIEALERQVELTPEPVEQVSLLRQIGDVRVRHLEQVDQAEDAYNRALAVNPEDIESLHALGDLHERHGNWFLALEMLSREASVLGSEPGAVHLFYRSGKISEEMLMDIPAAKESYQKALELDPAYTPALRALRKILVGEGQHAEVIQLQSLEARHSEDPETQAELYAQAAETALREFDDVAQTLRLLDRSLEADPTYVPALRTAGDLLFAEERWNEAEGILERLSQALNAQDEHAELGRTYYRLGYISEKIDDDERALERYLAAYELEATYLPTLEGLAAALMRAERWRDAQRIYHTILLQHRAALTDAEVVDLFFQIGELAVRLGEVDRAKTSFNKALDLDRHHAQTLRALANLAQGQRAWEEAYDYRERLIGILDGDERFEALVEQAQLCESHIREPYRAIDAYAEARRIKPEDTDALRALVRLFEETSQVPRQVEALEALAAAAEEPHEQRDVLAQLAEVHYRQRRDPTSAVQVLNQALDLDPTFVKAFQRIEQILYEIRDWSALEENYHRMIRRMPKDLRKARLVLWRSLGDLYSKALKNEDGARTAYEVVLSKLDPEAHDVALKLAAIYGNRKDTAQQALTLYQRVLPYVDDPAQPARRMFELYHALDQLDRAFCALAALILMRAATEDEARAYQLLLKRTPNDPQRAMTDTMWRAHILHPLCRNTLADILSIVYRGAPELFDEPTRALSLNRRKERVDLSKGRRGRAGLRYFAVWQRLANAMAVGDMEHYHRPGTTQPPRFYPGSQPVLFAGELHEIFKSTSSRQIAWTLARQMATARPEMAAVRAIPPDEVGALLEGVIRIFAPNGSGVDHPLDPRLVDSWRLRVHRSLSDRALKALREPVAACIHKKDMKRLSRFLEGAEHSASRAAVLMCGDVVAAERGLGESDHLVGLSFRARVRQLMLFVLSDEHFLLREKLGLAIPR